MKPPFITLIITGLALSFMQCSSQKEYITDSDYSFHGRFKKYKTFQFMKINETDTTVMKGLLENLIGKKLVSQGYKYSPHKPDIYVGYRVYEDDFKLTGYNQPQLEQYVYNDWPERLLLEDDSYVEPPPVGRPDTEYHDSKYQMKEGTLLITFFDRKRDRTVWTGYASGVFTNDYENIERSLKLATGKIMKEFRLLANGYVVN